MSGLATIGLKPGGRGAFDLPSAWAMISTAPPPIMELKDLGHPGLGARKDIAVLHAETRHVEMTLTHDRIAHVSGKLARRMTSLA